MWLKLKGDERINQRCATEGCGGQPTERLEAMGTGSNFCSGCRENIERYAAIAARDKPDDDLMDEIDADIGFPFTRSNPFGEN